MKTRSLIIVESPTKAKTLSKFLGRDYVIKASMGHIRDLPKKEIGVDVEKDFKPKYVVDRTKSKIIKALKEAAEKSDIIYLAPDHDREGEAIAWHLNEVLKKATADKEVYRIVFNEITKKAVAEALEHPGSIDMEKVDAQQARRVLDRLVGYIMSPLLWRVISKGLSAGRVQSVALRLICEREEEILKFIQKEYWSIEADFSKNSYPPFHAIMTKWQGKKIELNTKLDSDNILEKIKDSSYAISDKKVSNRKVQPLAPFITSSLQQEAARILNFSAKRTMITAQQLYEGVVVNGDSTALISYMRTDSLRLSQEAVESSRSCIKQRFGQDYLNPEVKVFKNKSTAQDAHEAIRPTDMMRTPETLEAYLKPDQFKLYSLIWDRTIATQMKPAAVQTINLEITGGEATFKASGGTITFKGFLLAYKHLNLNLGEDIDAAYSAKDSLEISDLAGKQHFTKPPARYSEASLIKELESKGIGRPSTYASITSTIQDRKYVILQEKRFHPTDLGKTVNTFLVAYFTELFNVEFTRNLEDELDFIAEGKGKWQTLVGSYYQKIDTLIKGLDIKKAKTSLTEKTDIKCNKCGSDMLIKWSSRGQFLACSNYPTCSNIQNFSRSEDGKIEIEKPEILEEKCPLDDAPLVVKNSRYGKFIGCSNYPQCKFTKQITTGIECPECHKGEIIEKNYKGKIFYNCSNYPECKFRSYNKPKGIKCPNCDDGYIEEVLQKDGSVALKCPKCKNEV